jgi:hypothetical protein
MRQAILEGACQVAQGATNLTRISEVIQKPDELPSQFYDRLCNAYHRYTPFDIEASANWSMINTTFIQPSASDVSRKLQKMEGFAGVNIDQLISIEAKVVANRKEMAKREKEKYLEKKAKILAMALKEGDGKTGGWKGGPTGENEETLWGKKPVCLL